MSLIAQPNGDDHPEAAAKHLADGDALLNNGRPDGAGYHAGYVIECCLKALVIVSGGPFASVHALDNLTQSALKLVALPGARTAKYAPWHTAGHSIYDLANGWKPSLRYAPEGKVVPTSAGDWVSEAKRVYAATIVPMRLDGVI